MRYVSARDAHPGDIVENEQKARGYVVTNTADDMLLVHWERPAHTTVIHWNAVTIVKCNG